MYAVERKRIIREYLKEHNQAQVQELGKLLNVSEVTVRRDLERLETEGLLTRTHGGAVLNKEDVDDPLLEVIERSGAKEDYDRIASIALRLVSDGDVVMLSNGPVNTRIAAALAKRSGLTVLTNDMSVALRVLFRNTTRSYFSEENWIKVNSPYSARWPFQTSTNSM